MRTVDVKAVTFPGNECTGHAQLSAKEGEAAEQSQWGQAFQIQVLPLPQAG